VVNHSILLAVLLSCFGVSEAQKLKKEDKQLVANLHHHIEYLASDKLEGRRTGTPGEALASDYIQNEFKKAGLLPKGSEGFLQAFDVPEGKQITSGTHLLIDGKALELNVDYFPLVLSPNTTVSALPSIALQEPKMPWFLDLKDLLEENAANPHFDLTESIISRASEAVKKGATALFLYNSSAKEDKLKFEAKDRSAVQEIPIIYLTKQAAKKYLSDESAALDIQLKTDITEKKRSGHNVAGYIDNGASSTIIIGAHYDHLGFGEDGGSREVEKKMQIHNGADDNASGTAALIELARLLKDSKLKNNNYLFIAFSGEELGLFGSKFFTEHPTIDLTRVNYMINMDMVGRLNDSSHVITVGGYGTSPYWGEAYRLSGKKKLYSDNIVVRFDSSGTGPSDHTSFYRKDIPVLFYFTGLHSDYHKPTDDFDKINYEGEMNVVRHILSVIDATDKKNEKLAFLKTRETQTTTSARFSVTMGIMPDYTFSGTGVRVDGVSDNRPAQKAGLKTGDIILSLGEHKIGSLENYMQALGSYKKGEKTSITYSREGQILSTTVEF
jgi:aminopeptidase YwaD